MTKESYLKEIETISSELKTLLFGDKKWELKKESKKISCKVFCTPATQGQGYVWKCEAQVPIPPEKLIDMVHPSEKYRPMWDPNINWCRLLEELTPEVFITHTMLKGHLLGLMSPRDTIDLFKIEETDKYISTQFGSTEYEKAPPSEGDCKRAWSYPSGIFFFKHDPSSSEKTTKVVIFFQVDGKLDVVPLPMLNAAMPTFMKQYVKSLLKTSDIQWTPLVNVPGRH